MANETWLSRPSLSSFTGAEICLVFQGGIAKKFTITQLESFIVAGAGLQTIDVSGASFDLTASSPNTYFNCSDTIGADKTITITRTSGLTIKFYFSLDAARNLTFPSTVKYQSALGGWDPNTYIWSGDVAGDYMAELSWNGTNWLLNMYGPY